MRQKIETRIRTSEQQSSIMIPPVVKTLKNLLEVGNQYTSIYKGTVVSVNGDNDRIDPETVGISKAHRLAHPDVFFGNSIGGGAVKNKKSEWYFTDWLKAMEKALLGNKTGKDAARGLVPKSTFYNRLKVIGIVLTDEGRKEGLARFYLFYKEVILALGLEPRLGLWVYELVEQSAVNPDEKVWRVEGICMRCLESGRDSVLSGTLIPRVSSLIVTCPHCGQKIKSTGHPLYWNRGSYQKQNYGWNDNHQNVDNSVDNHVEN